MVVAGEVKIRVRSNALDLKEFTVKQMRRVTGLNPASIRTEIQRMKREGYLTSEPVKERRGRGAPPHVYKLTSDPEKRLELAREVEAFYTPPPPPAPPKPTSLHFKAGVKLLDKLAAGQVGEGERDEVLDKARYHLDFAMHEEGVGIKKDKATEIIGACINCEQGRLEYLRGNDGDAERLFKKAKKVFVSADLPDEVARADEYLQSIQIRRRWMEMTQRGIYEPRNMARCVLETLKPISASLADRPLILLLMNLIEHLAPSARELVLAASHEKVDAMQRQMTKAREVMESVERRTRRIEMMLEEQMRWLPEKEKRRLLEEYTELSRYTSSGLEAYGVRAILTQLPRGRETDDA
jgi:DNA-binding PadR family transcriptional regulator